ncbi:DUF2939 domain-containing protein [Massilia sp. S19_KUP03_FR1]|uniref:DUF2939 domain-containing protein n=1 Tax=Massilia sp. S19_KUP03_FR1 TaxID=3025503 RepID=UPI002FCD49F7
MIRRKGKPALAALVVASAAVAAYWYWSPFLALRAMQSAAREQDAPSFNAHVDYPKLRASLKQQLALLVGEKIAPDKPLAAFGAMMGAALADQLVDAMVRPETVMRAMQSGRFGHQDGAPDASRAQNVQDPQPKWDWVRVGSDKLVAYRQDGSAEGGGKKVEVVFERSGFANWKLTALRLPSLQR